MKGSRSKAAHIGLPADPFLAWARVGLQAIEMLAASAHVIQHRTRRRNTPAQLLEMGNEKVQAAIESAHAMARHSLIPVDYASATYQWAALAAAAVAPFHKRAVSNARRMRRR
jgi:hypothetical protein